MSYRLEISVFAMKQLSCLWLLLLVLVEVQLAKLKKIKLSKYWKK